MTVSNRPRARSSPCAARRYFTSAWRSAAKTPFVSRPRCCKEQLTAGRFRDGKRRRGDDGPDVILQSGVFRECQDEVAARRRELEAKGLVEGDFGDVHGARCFDPGGCKPSSVCPADCPAGERTIYLSSHTRNPFRFRETRAGRSGVPYLALLPMGFSVPRCLRFGRCAFTAPFHPYLPANRDRRSVFCGTFRRPGLNPVSRMYPRRNRGYAASRPMEFGLSSRPPKRTSGPPPPVVKAATRYGSHSADASGVTLPRFRRLPGYERVAGNSSKSVAPPADEHHHRHASPLLYRLAVCPGGKNRLLIVKS